MKRVALGCLVVLAAFVALFAILFLFGAKEGRKGIEPLLQDLHAKRYDAVIDRYHANLTDQVPREQWKTWFDDLFATLGNAKTYEISDFSTNVQAGGSPSDSAPLGSGTYISAKATVEHERGKAEHEFTLFKPANSETTFVSRHKFRAVPAK
ncbi:MAG: hypothetical protein JSR82_23655 [Verrucomicrobia bacterium]|nr:hypothetical protein [Verrucomicrobiota bacterium]